MPDLQALGSSACNDGIISGRWPTIISAWLWLCILVSARVSELMLCRLPPRILLRKINQCCSKNEAVGFTRPHSRREDKR